MKLDSSHVPALMEDLERAVSEMKSALGSDPAGWTHGAAGKWTAGQHAAHLSMSLETGIDRLERAAAELRRGALGPRPRRGILQGFVVGMLMRDPFPRGGRATAATTPGPTPSRESVFVRLDGACARFGALVRDSSPEERERIWIQNYYREWRGWHYRLFELLRIEANHTRHHTKLALAAAKA